MIGICAPLLAKNMAGIFTPVFGARILGPQLECTFFLLDSGDMLSAYILVEITMHPVSLEIIMPARTYFHDVVQVLASSRGMWALGMNVLKNYVSTFNGPQLMLDIQP